MTMSEGLESIKESISQKIFGNDRNLSILNKLRQPAKMSQILATLGSVFKRKEQENIRQFLADFFASEIVQIADNDNDDTEGGSTRENVARAKLRIETRRWLMEQFAPHLYGSVKGGRETAIGPVFQTKIYLPENGRS